MRAKSNQMSRFAATLLALLVVMHSIVALDLFLNFFPETEEFRAMWSIALWAKVLWAVLCIIGAAGVFLLYRRPWLGFFTSAVFCACLYIASIQLWGEVKGGFWLAVVAAILAAFGAGRSNNSSKSTPRRGAA